MRGRGNAEEISRDRHNELGRIILDAGITVHRELGPGLLESAYELALARELELRSISFKLQVPVHLYYKGCDLGKGYVMDILVDDLIVIEIKSVDALSPIFEAQLITYLKLSGKRLGYLMNFNVPLLKSGFRRIVYRF